MRALSDTLLAAQKAGLLDPKPKLALSKAGETDVTYTETRIKSINYKEYPSKYNAEVLLDNSDGALTSLDFKGWTAALHWGLATTAGNESSQVAPMKATAQRLDSSPGQLTCELTLLGIPDLMDLDEASADYLPLDTDTKTVKTLIREIAGDTGVTFLACYNHCQAYDMVFDSEDSLISTYIPKNSFKIYTGGSRLTTIRRLLGYTKCGMRFGNDGKIHILQPTISGTTYDYKYSLKDPDAKHTFFSKAYRKTLVLPNYVTVTSLKDDAVQYSGIATSAASYALIPKRAYYKTSLTSNAQATSIAEAIIANLELSSELGSAEVPMNCGAELYDYVKVTDERENDSRAGNLGSIIRKYSVDARSGNKDYSMRFSFGDPPLIQEVKEMYQGIKRVSQGEAVNIGSILFNPITYDDVIDGIKMHGIKSAQIDASGLIFLDSIVDAGGTYKRTLASALDATGLVLLDQTVDGTNYKKVLASQVSAGRISLTAANYYAGKFSGEWYSMGATSGVDIDAVSGINIYGKDNALTTRATKTGTVRCYVGADGRIIIRDGYHEYRDSADEAHWGRWYFNIAQGGLCYTSSKAIIDIGRDGVIDFAMSAGATFGTRPGQSANYIYFRADADHIFAPSVTNYGFLGNATRYWYRVYAGKYYAKDTVVASFQDHDDIALIKSIKSKKVKDKHGKEMEVIDASALPKGIFVKEKTDDGREETLIDLGNFTSLGIGAIRQLTERVENLEKSLANLQTRLPDA